MFFELLTACTLLIAFFCKTIYHTADNVLLSSLVLTQSVCFFPYCFSNWPRCELFEVYYCFYTYGIYCVSHIFNMLNQWWHALSCLYCCFIFVSSCSHPPISFPYIWSLGDFTFISYNPWFAKFICL